MMSEHGPQSIDQLKAKPKAPKVVEIEWPAEEEIDLLDKNEEELHRAERVNHELNRFFHRLSPEESAKFGMYETIAITDAFHKIGKFRPEVATQYFSSTADASVEEPDRIKRWLRLEKKYFRVIDDPELRLVAEELMGHFSGVTLRLFIEKTMTVGMDATKNIFKDSSFVLQSQDAQYELLEQFLLDETELQQLAQEKLLASTPIPQPEFEARPGEQVVELEIPSLKFDPSWYEYHQPEYVLMEDDADYRLPEELVRYHNLEKAKPEDFVDILSGLRQGKDGQIAGAIERATGHGPVPPEKLQEIITNVRFVSEVWGLSDPEGELTPEQLEFQTQLREVEKMIPLPDSAGSLTVHNGRLNKDRVIESFGSALHKRLLEAAVSGAVDQARGQFGGKNSLMDQMITAETKARALYQEVVTNGMPVFKDFATYICEEDAKGTHKGEFYVGRDTLETLYPAAHAARWGKMTSGERHKKAVWVNVSRPLAGATTREVLRRWFEQEQVTEEMLGIDGGYSGSSPAKVFEALNPHLSPFELDKKIKLVENPEGNRRFNPNNTYLGKVSWLESLPKFTDRSQKIEQNEFGKYYVVDGQKRSPIERALAWTVQHAVWRELINHDPVAHSMSQKQELVMDSRGELVNKTEAQLKTEKIISDWQDQHAISYLDFDVGSDGQAFVNGDLDLTRTATQSLPAELLVAGDVLISADQKKLHTFLEQHGYNVKINVPSINSWWDQSGDEDDSLGDDDQTEEAFFKIPENVLVIDEKPDQARKPRKQA